MLDDLLEYRLTLIAAPAGYGKTSLLVDLVDTVEYPICWLALDQHDLDPLRFAHYFIAAIQQQFPDFGEPSRSLLDNLEVSDLGSEQILHTIINDLFDHVQEHFALVLDDFHLIDSSPDINRFINRFVQEMDENCHLVIATRSLLSLPDLPLMIGRSEVQGLSFEELVFLPEEIRDLFRLRYQQTISDQEIEQIVDESEGWITGLLLTAETAQQGLTDQGRAARAAGVDLYDYLARQVLDHQLPEMQDFLLRTSLLEEFNAELCQQVLGDPEGHSTWEDLIQHLLQKNLFIQPVDSEGTWLRYHQLFRDFLQQHFKKLYPGQARDLLQRLVDVYRDRRWFEKAYTTCLQLGDEQLVADYIDSVSSFLFHSGQIYVLKSWLDELSPDLVENNPGLLGNRGALASMTGDPESGLRMLNRAVACLSPEEDPVLYSQLLIRRASSHRMLGSYQLGLDDAFSALELVGSKQEGKNLLARAESEIGLNMLRMGLNQDAKEHLEISLNSYLDQDDQQNGAFVQMDLGLIEMNEGRYNSARSLYQQAYRLWGKLGNFTQLAGLCNNLGVLDHLTGKFLEAFDWFSRGLDYARQTSNQRGTAFIMASLADLARDLGALSTAEAYLNQSNTIAQETGDTSLQMYLLLTMSALARRRGELRLSREYLDAAGNQLGDSLAGYEKGRYHLENGLLLMEEDLLEQVYPEFEKAWRIFAKIKLPVETGLALVQLARINCLRAETAQAERKLESVREIIRSLGTIRPLVPAVSVQDDLLTCLEEHLPGDPFTRELVREVSAFKSHLPGILEKLEFNILPVDSTHQPLLDITAMGRVSVKSKGELISAPEWTKQKKVRELFFYLLSYPEGASRDEICLEFWPDSRPEQLKKQFKNALYRLRRAVGKDTILYHPPTRLYHFNRSLDYRYDVEEFYKSLDLAQDEEDPERKYRLLCAAADLYQHPFGPSLEGIWAGPVRYRLSLDYERIMLAIAQEQLSRDRVDSALQTLEKLLVAVPDQEIAWRMAMRSYALKSDRSGIERTYQRCRQALAQELDAEPSADTLALYRELMA